MKVQIWFLGKLCRVEANWNSGEYIDGHLYQPGYWDITDLIDVETGMDVWLDRQVSAELSVDEAEELSDEVYNWLMNGPGHWTEDDKLYRTVEKAFIDAMHKAEHVHLYYLHNSGDL